MMPAFGSPIMDFNSAMRSDKFDSIVCAVTSRGACEAGGPSSPPATLTAATTRRADRSNMQRKMCFAFAIPSFAVPRWAVVTMRWSYFSSFLPTSFADERTFRSRCRIKKSEMRLHFCRSVIPVLSRLSTKEAISVNFKAALAKSCSPSHQCEYMAN